MRAARWATFLEHALNFDRKPEKTAWNRWPRVSFGKALNCDFIELNGGPCRVRTYDHRIKSPVLYH